MPSTRRVLYSLLTFAPCAMLCCLPAFGAQSVPPATLLITHGGIYQGRWTSDNADIPVVRIQTTQPVVIQNSTLSGRGALVVADDGNADLTIRDTRAVGMNPDILGRCAGRFVDVEDIAHLSIEHCQLDNTAGIYIHRAVRRPPGDPGARPTIRIVENLAHNIDGRRSDGRGGYQPFNIRTRVSDGHVETGFDIVQFVQFDGVTGIADAEIAWNHVINDPGASRVEDNINLYQSSGTQTSPILIHDNCIEGAYTIDPAQADRAVPGYREDWQYSGGGIMLGDGAGDSIADASGYVSAFGNVVVGTSNYGIAIASGHDIVIDRNLVISSGMLPGERRITAQNVGIYIWDASRRARHGANTFFNNRGAGNGVGWAGADSARNDWWTPDAAAWMNNRHLPGPITITMERRAVAQWMALAAAARRLIGPGSEAGTSR